MHHGKFGGEPFTKNDALALLDHAYKEEIFNTDDLELFKELHPQLKDGINTLIASDVVKKVDETVKATAISPLSAGQEKELKIDNSIVIILLKTA